MNQEEVLRLQETARLMRINILRMLHRAKSGHTGGSLSAADIITALYFRVMNHRPEDPEWSDRDRFAGIHLPGP